MILPSRYVENFGGTSGRNYKSSAKQDTEVLKWRAPTAVRPLHSRSSSCCSFPRATLKRLQNFAAARNISARPWPDLFLRQRPPTRRSKNSSKWVPSTISMEPTGSTRPPRPPPRSRSTPPSRFPSPAPARTAPASPTGSQSTLPRTAILSRRSPERLSAGW